MSAGRTQSHPKNPANLESTESAPRVLIVDDSQMTRHWIGSFLRDEGGFRVETASSGEAASRMIATYPPHLVLTDIQMPDMNGFELVAEIQKTHPELPVILMTAFGNEDIAIQALRAGASNYVPKKDIERDLIATVQTVLSFHSSMTFNHFLSHNESSIRSHFVVGNDTELIPPLIAMLQAGLDVMGICDRNGRTRAGVALHEALTNAIYHGNLEVCSSLRQDDERIFYQTVSERRITEPYRGRRVEISVEIDRESATYKVRDEGPGYDVPEAKHFFDAEDLMRIGGRGLLLIRTFMDEVKHNDTGNEITMIRRKAKSPIPAEVAC